ncbi:hypothetical protein B0H11DRAFT_1932743 [Mycena galericulata]|nr:hypothetical protein B0H11DRAFT_1932743 [Mycena galericulata]
MQRATYLVEIGYLSHTAFPPPTFATCPVPKDLYSSCERFTQGEEHYRKGIGGLPPWKLPGRERREAGSTYPGHHFWELPPKQGHVIWLLACTPGVPPAGCIARTYCWLAALPTRTAGWLHCPHVPLAGRTAHAYRWLAAPPGVPLAGLHPGRTAGWPAPRAYRRLAALPARTAGWPHCPRVRLAAPPGVPLAGLHCPGLPLAGCTAHAYRWLAAPPVRTAGWPHCPRVRLAAPPGVPLAGCTPCAYRWLAAPPVRTTVIHCPAQPVR